MQVDPGTGLTVLGTAVGSAKILEKILGPTAEYLGTGMRDWTERGIKNVSRIFQKTAALLGDRIEDPGSVPPKVLKEILAEGAFAEDELSSDYFAGVLASSKSEVNRDDRGAAFAALVGRLSTYQIRSHFIFYSLVRKVFSGKAFNLAAEGRNECEIFVPLSLFVSAMEFGTTEAPEALLPHVLFGLQRESLIEANFQYGPVDTIRRRYAQADSDAIIVTPSALGAELFLWAHGLGNLGINLLLDPKVSITSETQLIHESGVRSTKHPALELPLSGDTTNGGAN
jgi:hypothetical protein